MKKLTERVNFKLLNRLLKRSSLSCFHVNFQRRLCEHRDKMIYESHSFICEKIFHKAIKTST